MSKNTKITKRAGRSKKYSANYALLEEAKKNNQSEIFTIEEALKVLQTFENPNFKNGTTVELHFNLAINPTKSDQLVRSSVLLPFGTGKEIKIAAFINPENEALAKKLGCYKVGGEDLIEELKNSGKVDFDIAIAQPDLMKKLPVIARLLGTSGVMPNPKTGTVGDNIEEIINLIKAGKVDYKNDKSGNIHFAVGKLNKNFDLEKLSANITAGVDSVDKSKPDAIKKKFINSISISSTMSPSIKIR
jgi:large subunit ribosomal protein L1